MFYLFYFCVWRRGLRFWNQCLRILFTFFFTYICSALFFLLFAGRLEVLGLVFKVFFILFIFRIHLFCYIQFRVLATKVYGLNKTRTIGGFKAQGSWYIKFINSLHMYFIIIHLLQLFWPTIISRDCNTPFFYRLESLPLTFFINQPLSTGSFTP